MNIELKNIHKTFGAVHANVGINLDVPSGTIMGILGENGAGKSTLMKILSGFFSADEGEIFLDGKPVNIHSPADAIRLGVGMLHQDPMDFPPLRVIDNFILGSKGGFSVHQPGALKEFLQLAGQFSFSLDPEAFVDSLTIGERQQLEILRLIWEMLLCFGMCIGLTVLFREKLLHLLLIGPGYLHKYVLVPA